MKNAKFFLSMLKATFMLLAVSMMTVSLTACSSDDDDSSSGNGNTTNTIKVDGVEKSIANADVVYYETDTKITIYFEDGTKLVVGLDNNKFGENIDMTKKAGEGVVYSYAEYYYNSGKNDMWYGDNDTNDEGEMAWILGAGSFLKVDKDGDTFTINGKFVFDGDTNYVEDGKTHTVTISVTVKPIEKEAKEEAQ